MNPFKLIAGFVRWLWQASMLLRYPFDSGLRTGSRVAGLYMFLVLFFLVLGVVLVSLGFDLDAIDRWLDAHGGGIGWVASAIFRLFCGFVFLLGLAASGAMLFQIWQNLAGHAEPVGEPEPEDAEPPAGTASLGCGVLTALAIAYFAWFGMIA